MTPTFYTSRLPPSTNLPNDLFDKSADLTKKGIERNNYNHQPDIGTSPQVLLVNLTSQSMVFNKPSSRFPIKPVDPVTKYFVI